MKRLLLHFGLALLACWATALPSLAQTTAPNPYDAQARELERAYASADAPQQAVLLHQLYGLREYVDDPAPLTAFFAEAASAATANPLVRDEALYLLSRQQLHAGNLEASRHAWRDLGFVADWAIVGPFGAGAAPMGPEQGFHPDAQYKDSAGRVRTWRRAPSIGPRGWLDLSYLYPRADLAVVFAATAVYLPQAQAVALRFGADSPVGLYVNGHELGGAPEQAFDSGTGFAFDQHAAGVRLQAGWNSIVLKLRRNGGAGPWRFALRISGTAGGGLQLAASAEQAVPPGDVSTAPAANLVSEARETARTHANSADALDTLGLLERAHGLDGQRDHLEQAARLAPTAARWLAVAATCAESSCTFSALNAAAALDGADARVPAALADYYFARGQSDKARSLLQKAIALAPGDFVLRKRLGDIYVSAGLNSLALAEYRKLETIGGGSHPAPLWLRRELGARYEDLGLLDRALALQKAALAADFDGDAERAALVRTYQRRGDSAGLRACYRDAMTLDPGDPAPLSEIAQLDAAAGNYAPAAAEMRSAIALAPGDDALHAQLADILESAGQKSEARTELARALDANPASAADRRRLALTTGAVSGDEDAAYLVNAAELAAQAHRQPPHDAATGVELADIRVERVQENGLSAVHVQQVAYLASEQGAREYATRSIQYANGSQRLAIVAARAYKPDGRVLDAEDAGEGGVADTSIAMYYDSRSRLLRFPALEKGDVVEIEYRLTPDTAVNPYGDYFGELETFGSSLPRRLQRYVLVTPAAREFHISPVRMPHPAQVRVSGGERTYTWEARNLEPMASEPRGPALTEVSPYVSVSTLASWQQVGQWYAQLIAPQFALDSTLRDALAQLLAGKNTDQEKIAAIHQFVLRNTHYVALEFGVYGYKPYPVSQVYARRFGDCKDKASLMIALLRAAGIDADIALVRTRRMGDVVDQATSISIFNHAVVYVPRYDLWLDGTAEYAGSRELPLDDQGAMALTVAQNGNAQLRRIPVTLPMENYTHRQVTAQVQPDGRIQFTGSAYTRGEDAPGLRRDFEVRERQRDSFRNRLAEVLPSVLLEQVQVEGANDLERDVVVNFRGALDTFAGRRSILLASSWMHRSYVQTLAALPTRTQDLLLPAPWTTEEELHFALPAGARVDALQDKVLESPFGAAVLRYQRKGTELVITTSVQFRKLRITPAEYGAFRDFCAQIENAFRNEIKVVM